MIDNNAPSDSADHGHPARPVVALSGGFDPPTPGHVSMIQDARNIGDVVIILNSDAWCDKARWSGKRFIPLEKRRRILELIPGVVRVMPADDEDGTVCASLRELLPDFFGNGGNRTVENTPEVRACKELKIGMLWFLGQNVSQHAHDILKEAVMEAAKDHTNDG